MLNHDLEEQLYGNWVRLVSDWRVNNQNFHEANVAKVVNQREYLRNQVEEIRTAMERQKEQEQATSSVPRDGQENQGTALSAVLDAGKEAPQTSSKPNSESGSGEEQTRESQEKKIDALRKEVSNMTVEKLEEIIKSKKRGRPKKDEKELRQLSKKELDRKKSISGGPNPKNADE